VFFDTDKTIRIKNTVLDKSAGSAVRIVRTSEFSEFELNY
jgi:hypothetical protein